MKEILKQRIWPIVVIVVLIIYLGSIMTRSRATKTVIDSYKQSPENLMQPHKKKQ